MAKKFKWTLNKAIATLLVIMFFLFVLFLFGVFDKFLEQFSTASF